MILKLQFRTCFFIVQLGSLLSFYLGANFSFFFCYGDEISWQSSFGKKRLVAAHSVVSCGKDKAAGAGNRWSQNIRIQEAKNKRNLLGLSPFSSFSTVQAPCPRNGPIPTLAESVLHQSTVTMGLTGTARCSRFSPVGNTN